MGVDLGDLTAARPLAWSEMSGRVLAVDTYNTLYQFLSSVRQADGTPLMDSKGRVTGHLAGLFYRSVKWLESGIKPVFVFDGKPPELKAKTLAERRERKAEAHAKMAVALNEGRTEDARLYAQQTSKLTPEMAGQARQLLEALGLPTVQAPSEGEAEAADLVNRGLAWAAASQDYDSLLFGSPRLVRNLSTSGRRKLPRRNEYVDITPELLELDAVLTSASINRYQLIWMGMLVGTDFNAGVRGIGPKKALKLVAGAHSFKDVISRLPPSSRAAAEEGPSLPPAPPSAAEGGAAASAASRSPEPPEGLENWEAVEEFFLKPPVSATSSIRFGKPDKEKAVRLLCGEFDFSPERVTRTLDALEKQQKEVGSQKRLGDW
ncbi:MAG: flap endonuclease-1 [Candidatus Micrarchaeota archaeon]|nr:flap endonuclease-1 [Candidatus Micrarchaeota archaeon]